jgi:hypothetical protein
MKDDGYGGQTTTGEVDDFELIKGKLFGLKRVQVKLQRFLWWTTYRRAKKLTFIYEFHEKRHVFGAKKSKTVRLVVTCLLQPSDDNSSRPLRRRQYTLWYE